MSDAAEYGPEEQRTGIPRDLPDQEADPDTAKDAGTGEDLPDTDEAGSGPRTSGLLPPKGEEDSPEPEEPTD